MQITNNAAARRDEVEVDGARAQHRVVVPLCPFVTAYIGRHPEHLPSSTPRTGRGSNGRVRRDANFVRRT